VSEYERRLDRVLMFLSKYAHQDATKLEKMPTTRLLAWVDRITDLLREEQEAAEGARKS